MRGKANRRRNPTIMRRRFTLLRQPVARASDRRLQNRLNNCLAKSQTANALVISRICVLPHGQHANQVLY